jgi:hypothetical protein
MRRWLAPILVAGSLGALAPFAGTGCGSSATGVGVCKQIEDARCQAAANCSQIALSPPYYTSGSGTDACIRFYDTACLHGLAVATPSQTQVDACVSAIQKPKACAVVIAPWTSPACTWLVPPDSGSPVVDAGDGGDASNAADSESDAGGE